MNLRNRCHNKELIKIVKNNNILFYLITYLFNQLFLSYGVFINVFDL